MGGEIKKIISCENCGECDCSEYFLTCFCCEAGEYVCINCVIIDNCVDKKQDSYMCDDCIINAPDEKIIGGANRYRHLVKNVDKIIKRVKKLRKTVFSDIEINVKINNGDIQELNNELKIINI
jgi:hypothetical protein